MTEELEFSSSDKEIEEKDQKPTNCWFEKTKQNENEDSKKSLFFSSSLNSHPVTKKLKKKSKKLF